MPQNHRDHRLHHRRTLRAPPRRHARIWYRDQGLHDEWYDCVYEDFQTICTDPRRNPRNDQPPCASTAAVRGTNRRSTGAASAQPRRRRELRRPLNKPREGSDRQSDPRPHALKDDRTCIPHSGPRCRPFRRINFWQLQRPRSCQRGRYCHEYTMRIEVERDSPTWQPPTDGAEDAVIEAHAAISRAGSTASSATEYEHLTSDDADRRGQSQANDWSFTAAGESASADPPAALEPVLNGTRLASDPRTFLEASTSGRSRRVSPDRIAPAEVSGSTPAGGRPAVRRGRTRPVHPPRPADGIEPPRLHS